MQSKPWGRPARGVQFPHLRTLSGLFCLCSALSGNGEAGQETPEGSAETDPGAAPPSSAQALQPSSRSFFFPPTQGWGGLCRRIPSPLPSRLYVNSHLTLASLAKCPRWTPVHVVWKPGRRLPTQQREGWVRKKATGETSTGLPAAIRNPAAGNLAWGWLPRGHRNIGAKQGPQRSHTYLPLQHCGPPPLPDFPRPPGAPAPPCGPRPG